MIIIGRKLGIDIKYKYMKASSFCNEFLSNQFLFQFAICMQISEMKECHVWCSLTNCFFFSCVSFIDPWTFRGPAAAYISVSLSQFANRF